MKPKLLLLFGLVMLFLVSSSFVSAEVTQDDLLDGLVSYWKFDETSGTTAEDSHGTNDGTNNGATINQVGQINKAYSFDGTNDNVEITQPTETQGTFNIWLKADDLSTVQRIFSLSDVTTTGNFFQFVLLTTGEFLIGDSSARGVQTQNTFNADTWYMVTFVSTGTAYKIYVDGIEQTLDVTSGNTGNWFGDFTGIDNVWFGKWVRSTGSGYFKGILDEPAMWNRSLDSTEVTMLYDIQKDGFESGSYDFQALVGQNFTITAQDIYTNTSITNFSVDIDGQTYFSNNTGSIITHIYQNDTNLYNFDVYNATGYFDRTFNNINVSENYVASLYPYFKVFAKDAISGDTLENISVKVDGTTYTTTTGEVQISLMTDNSLTKDLFVWALDPPEYFNKTIRDQIIGRNLTVELYKKNSVLIQTYWENGTQISSPFDVRFTSDLPSVFTTTTNATGGLFYNNLSIASWKIDVFNGTIPLRSYYVDVEDFSFTKLDVYFPLPDDQEVKTFKLEDSLRNVIEDGLITFTKFIDDSFVSLGQIKTDSTGTESFILNNGESYRLIIEAEGFDTKIFNIVANVDTTTYTIVLLTDTLINFTTVFDKFTFSVTPLEGVIAAQNTNFTLTTSSKGSTIQWFYLKSGSTITNVTGSPAGGTAIITLDLNNTNNENVLVEYGIKVQGFAEYQFSNNYFVYIDRNLSTSLGGAREDVTTELDGNIILGAFLSAFIILILSFLFPVDQIKGTKSLNGLGIVVSVSIFAWFGLFPLLISILVGTLTLLSIVGGSQ